MSHRRFEPGTVLADKYRLDGLLGEGGMGTVYRATHLLLKSPVAIKVIDREVSSGDVALARFMREAQAAASLRSPHVVQVMDYGSAEGSPFMVMELLEGENLAQRIERLGRLTPGETYRVITHVARAIAKAHEAGIVHRDLKPDNVFLVHNEGDEVAKVLDFGVAKVEATALSGGSHTRTGSLLGTPYYMSPEQAQGNKEVDHRSDLWALAVIAFECLTGKRPFYSDGLGDIVLQICVRDIPRPSSVSEVPLGFDDWFAHATQREPADRFQSARELSEALRDALGVQRDPTGSVPESQWSTAAAPPVSRIGGMTADAASTERDQVKPDALTMESAPGYSPFPEPVQQAPVPDVVRKRAEDPAAPGAPAAPPGHRSARWEESVPAHERAHSPSASWKVVPVGPSDPPPKLLKPESEPPPPQRSFLGVFFVAALALSLGAGLVYLAREHGSDFVSRTLRGDAKVKVPKAKKTRKSGDASAVASAEAARRDDEADKPSHGARGTGSKAPPGPDKSKSSVEDRRDEDDALDEFERQIRTTPPRDGNPSPADPPSPGPSDDASQSADGPTPGVPDGLIPAPPPPPPVEPLPSSGTTGPQGTKP
jgi:serine/threonine protein kinase